MAAALWGLDYLAWWAEHGANGINFHTGDKVAAGEENTVCQYAVFISADDGYTVRPLAYALKAFDLMDHGKIGTAKIAKPDDLNFTTYTVSNPEKHDAFALLINKEYESGKDADVTIDVGKSYGRAAVMKLVAPDNDVAAQSGVTLGGSAIDKTGSWSGDWSSLPAPTDGKLTVKIPAASAAVVKLSAK